MTVFVQVDVHVLPSLQTELSLPVSYETHTDTEQANINWEEVCLADQLGCCWLAQPHDSAGWSQTSSCLYLWALGHSQRCASVYSPPHLYNMSCRREELEIGDARQHSHRYLHLAAQFVFAFHVVFITERFQYCVCDPSYTAYDFSLRDAELCQLLSPSPVLFFFLLFCFMKHPWDTVAESPKLATH